MASRITVRPVQIPEGAVRLDGDLQVPPAARGLVIFAHGSGSSRFSTRNREVAARLNEAAFATLLLDLLTPREESIDRYTGEFRFDIPRLGVRVVAACDWASADAELRALPAGCFGASTGAAAALIAAAERPSVLAVVSRGGRPDLAGEALGRVNAPTLLIVGGDDEPVITMNEDARRRMKGEAAIEIVPGATHLFEEPGALERVSQLAIDWFVRHLVSHSVVSGFPGRRSAEREDDRRSSGAFHVPIDRWGEVLDSFSREHRAWLAHVERDGVPDRGADRPLTGVRPEAQRGAVVAIRIAFDEGTPADVRVDRPIAMVLEREAGASTGLRIEDADGHRTTLRFRVATPEGMLDGVAPGEL